MIEASYGRDDPAAVSRVKALYADLDLKGIFRQYEEDSFHRLIQSIEQQAVLPQVQDITDCIITPVR